MKILNILIECFDSLIDVFTYWATNVGNWCHGLPELKGCHDTLSILLK